MSNENVLEENKIKIKWLGSWNLFKHQFVIGFLLVSLIEYGKFSMGSIISVERQSIKMNRKIKKNTVLCI
jgi:hypothetical protein